MNAAEQKSFLRNQLKSNELDVVINWAATSRNPLRRLLSLTFDTEETVIWPAIKAIGILSADMAANDKEKIRDTIRRLLWLMSDESGGLSWHSPEIIAEILINVPSLIVEYAPLLPAYFVEEPFERGTHLAVARLAVMAPIIFSDCGPQLNKSLEHSDPIIRGSAVRILESVGARDYLDRINNLVSDRAAVRIYDFENSRFIKSTVGQIAQDAAIALISTEPVA